MWLLDFHKKGSLIQSFDLLVSLYKLLNKQSSGWRLETLWCWGPQQVDPQYTVKQSMLTCSWHGSRWSPGISHWNRDKMASAICRHFQVHLFERNSCSLVQISQKFVPKDPFNNKPSLVQATSHYMNQWWLSLLMSKYVSLSLKERYISDHGPILQRAYEIMIQNFGKINFPLICKILIQSSHNFPHILSHHSVWKFCVLIESLWMQKIILTWFPSRAHNYFSKTGHTSHNAVFYSVH